MGIQNMALVDRVRSLMNGKSNRDATQVIFEICHETSRLVLSFLAPSRTGHSRTR